MGSWTWWKKVNTDLNIMRKKVDDFRRGFR